MAVGDQSLTHGRAASKWNSANVDFSDIQSDIVIQVNGVGFALHKFPLSSRSRLIMGLIAESKDAEHCHIDLSKIPGGAEAFELAAKFCYGIGFEINASNVAYLRCAADYLAMTEDCGDENLIAQTEAYLNGVALQSLEKASEVLLACESLLPYADEIKIVSRCIDAVASLAYQKQTFSTLSHTGRVEKKNTSEDTSPPPGKASLGEWWADALLSLRIDLFQRVVSALKSRGLSNQSIGLALMHYAQKVLKKQLGGNLDEVMAHGSINRGHAMLEHEQRIVVETVVSLLPTEKNATPISFLIALLRAAVFLDTTIACRLDLERRIGLQLDQVTLDDLLIRSFPPSSGGTLFDIDIVHRLLMNFLQTEDTPMPMDTHPVYESDDESVIPSQQRSIMKVAKLIDLYLAEIAPDANLKVPKFIALAEQLPDYARVIDDGLYRAIDIYLKAHPSLPDVERKRICKLMDCQKLSQEACTHAAQNERLPVQLVVQVLYFEQARLRDAFVGSVTETEAAVQVYRPPPFGNGFSSASMSPRDTYESLRRENQELKLEVINMKARLSELEKRNAKQEADNKPPPPPPPPSHSSTNFFSSFGKRLGKINPFSRNSFSLKPAQTPEQKTARRRRHSIS